MARKPFPTFRQTDVNRLKTLVRQFNAKITRVSRTLTLASAQPQRIKYSELLSRINSRQEFNRVIGVYSRYLRRGSERLYTNESGVTITRWLRNESNYAIRRINNARMRKREEFESEGIRNSDELNLSKRRNHIRTITNKSYIPKYFRSLQKEANVDYYFLGEENYKRNYLAALRKVFTGLPGFSRLYKTVLPLSGETLIKASSRDPSLEIGFTYGFEAALLKLAYLQEVWDEYIGNTEL